MAAPPRAELDGGDAGDRVTVKDLSDQLGIKVSDVSVRLGRAVAHNSRLDADDVDRVRNWTPDDDENGAGAAGSPAVTGQAGGTVRERLENLDDDIAAARASQPVAALGGTPGPAGAAVDLGPVLARLDGIGSAVDGVATRQEAMAAWAGGVDTRIRRIDDRLDELGENVDRFGARVTALETGGTEVVARQLMANTDFTTVVTTAVTGAVGPAVQDAVGRALVPLQQEVEQVGARAREALNVATAVRDDVAAVRTEVDEIRRGGIAGRAAEGNPAALAAGALIGFLVFFTLAQVMIKGMPRAQEMAAAAIIGAAGLIAGLLVGSFVPASSGQGRDASRRQSRRQQPPPPPSAPAAATTTPPTTSTPQPDPAAAPTGVMQRVS